MTSVVSPTHGVVGSNAVRWRTGALAIVVVPVVVAFTRALVRGWGPIGDNGILVVRADDVLTRHHPLLGSWTSASIASGQAVHNPGPLYFDMIAAPVKLFGHSVGLALGVALVNVAAVVFAVLVAERVAGRTSMVAMAAAVVVVEWSVGSELLFDVWQPNALMLPGIAFMVATWAIAAGRLSFLPWVIGIGSLLVQTHLSYVYLVPLATISAIAIAVAGNRGANATMPWRRPLAGAAVVALFAWAQPLFEQFTSSGQGNIASLLDASNQDSQRLGARLGIRLMAEVLATPPFIGRSSFTDAVPASSVVGAGDNVPVVGIVPAIVALMLLVAVVVASIWWRHRRDERAHVAHGVLTLALLAGCLISLTLMPVGAVGLASHQMRWLWSVGAMVFVLLICTVVDAGRNLAAGRSLRLDLDAVPIALGALVAVLALPTYVSPSGPTDLRDSLGTARELGSQLGALEGRGTVLFDTSTLVFGEPYSGYVFSELRRRDIPFVFESGVDIRQFGEGRRDRGDAELRIWLVAGTAGLDAPPAGTERVALVRGLSSTELEARDELERRLREDAAERGLPLSASGRRAVEAGRLPATAREPAPGQHPWDAIGDLNLAVEEGWLDLPADIAHDYTRFVDLNRQRFFGTIAVLAAPVDVRPSN
ncbi:MAG: hypothetical protein M3Q72_07600 [Actinomycetota bacterium]|nr:hypothetical protein [Actinomycetota bacterium]